MPKIIWVADVQQFRPNVFRPSILQAWDDVGRFPCGWAIDTPTSTCVGMADVTQQQLNAINGYATVRTFDYADLSLTVGGLPAGVKAALTGWLNAKSIAWSDSDTLLDILLRVCHIAQPGWTWQQIEDLYAQSVEA